MLYMIYQERLEVNAHYLPVLISLPHSWSVRPVLSIQVPGEFGNDTLCTDPAWHTALAALTWLGLPYEVEHEEVKPRSTRATVGRITCGIGDAYANVLLVCFNKRVGSTPQCRRLQARPTAKKCFCFAQRSRDCTV